MMRFAFLFLILILLLGGPMGCVAEKSGNWMPSFWEGKFPVMVIAHRGFSGSAPENTLAAFKKAMEIKSDVIEFDVRFSRDGHLVVFHDDTLERTTHVQGKVADHTLKALQQLDAGSWFNPVFAGERIPTLKEVLDVTRGRIRLNIEIKKGDHGKYSMLDLADQTLHEVEKAEMEQQVLFSSFDLSALERVHEKNPRVPVAFITRDPWNIPQDAMKGKSFPVLNPRKSVLNENNLSMARQQGIRVNVWTLNTEEEMEKFISMGVNGIITDHPDRLIELLKRRYR
jgi:glycerophosphoryl diester phosphodiesterase